MNEAKIIAVRQEGLAAEIGLVPGDIILSVNEQKLTDIIDFSFAFAEEEIDLLVRHADGDEEIISFDKDADEELGAEFSAAVFDGIRPCANNCCFCFVRQVAPGLRHALSVKDDDYRLSFLYGNFITLTNMRPEDYNRIAALHLSPLFVSVHTMNGELRQKMLRSPQAVQISDELDKLERAGVYYHTQIVLCPELNDGVELDYTIEKLWERRPFVLSLAIVPVGLTKFHRDKIPLRAFTKTEAQKIIRQVGRWQEKIRRTTGITWLYLGDEFYLLAGESMPSATYYDEFPQLDNGIGLVRNFIDEWETAQATQRENKPLNLPRLVFVSGTAFAPVLKSLLHSVNNAAGNLQVLPVTNNLFGDSVTVSGLLAGKDIAGALRAEDLTAVQGIVLPAAALRAGDDIFVDDYALSELKQSFPHQKIAIVGNGEDLWHIVTAWETYRPGTEANYIWQSGTAYTIRSK